jgi:RNA 3'-terminal phosphate cyclase (ATP)
VLTIDASRGEGSGQIVRTALALSLATRTPFVLERIRAGRMSSGLGPQHVAALEAAAVVGDATVEGAEAGSQRIGFSPRRLVPGTYRFKVGPAGSAVLVTQMLVPALLQAREPSELVVEGGTHYPLSPSYEYYAESYLGVLKRLGADVRTELWKHGFSPEGGGALRTWITPRPLRPLHLLERGRLLARRGVAKLANLPRGIAEREVGVIERRLRWGKTALAVEEVDADCKGNVVAVILRHGEVTIVDDQLGNTEDRAEVFANALCDRLEVFLATGVPVDERLADQIVLPLALAGGGSFRTLEPSAHLMTQLDVLRQFLPDLKVTVEPDGRGHTTVNIARG